jgi:ClpP class serine protease
MRLERLAREIYGKPWLTTAEVHHRIHKLFQRKLDTPRADFQAKDRTVEICGDKITLDSMVVDDGIAMIPFAGVLINGAGDWEKWAGALAHADVTADIEEALSDPQVDALMFLVDSPGGTVAGSFELAELVKQASDQKPTQAFVEGLCCSAAFLSLSACSMIYGTRTCEMGAIECYLPFCDVSARYKDAGYEMDIIKPDQSVHAAAGYPGTSLTDEQREYMKSQVTDLLNMYVAHLEEVRSQVPEEAMDGRTFIGERAIEVGMLDAITTKSQAVADLRKWVDMRR